MVTHLWIFLRRLFRLMYQVLHTFHVVCIDEICHGAQLIWIIFVHFKLQQSKFGAVVHYIFAVAFMHVYDVPPFFLDFIICSGKITLYSMVSNHVYYFVMPWAKTIVGMSTCNIWKLDLIQILWFHIPMFFLNITSTAYFLFCMHSCLENLKQAINQTESILEYPRLWSPHFFSLQSWAGVPNTRRIDIREYANCR